MPKYISDLPNGAIADSTLFEMQNGADGQKASGAALKTYMGIAGLNTAISTLQTDVAKIIGVGQTWQAVTRNPGNAYQNVTGRPIMFVASSSGLSVAHFEISVDGTAWQRIYETPTNVGFGIWAIIPDGIYYRFAGSLGNLTWELR